MREFEKRLLVDIKTKDALWVVGARSFLVQHRCSQIEREIVFTDWRMVDPSPEGSV